MRIGITRCVAADNDAGDIAQAKFGDAVAEPRIDAVACIDQHGSRWHASLQCRFDLSQGNLWFGLKRHVVGNPSPAASALIVGRCLRQIQSKCDRQAGVVVGN